MGVLSRARYTCWSHPPSSTEVGFQYRIRVRFSEVDQAGVAYFSRIYEYCHRAFEELLRAADMPLEGLLHQVGWGLPLVHTEADYHRPLRLGDAISIEVTVLEQTDRRISFGFRVLGEDGQVRARVKHVHACVGMEDFRPRELPSAFLDGLARLDLLDQD